MNVPTGCMPKYYKLLINMKPKDKLKAIEELVENWARLLPPQFYQLIMNIFKKKVKAL